MPEGVLFIHNNFPGQFRDLAQTLIAKGVPVRAVGQDYAPGVSGASIVRYRLPRSTTPNQYDPVIRPEADLIRAYGAFKAMQHWKSEGFDPQAIVAHSGWGETIYAHTVFPAARQVLFAEFFYHATGFDVGFDREFSQLSEDRQLEVEAKNLGMAMAYARADSIVTPTAFQASTLPKIFQSLTRVIHEGIDTNAIRPAPPTGFELPDGRVLPPGTPVITHINNKMEPLRGLHIFARALPRLMAEVPDAHVIIIGQNQDQGYGGPAPNGRTWTDVAFDGVTERIDASRLHMLGKVPHPQMLAALRASAAHVYYTYPFVLSWSLCEAMASGCYVIGSDTPPLHDAITDGVNGTLLPFFDVEALSEAMIRACRTPEAFAHLRKAARETAVAKFEKQDGRRAWQDLLREHGVKIPD